MLDRCITANILVNGLAGGGAERVVVEVFSSSPRDFDMYLSINRLKDKAYNISGSNIVAFDELSVSSTFLKILNHIHPHIIYNGYLHYHHLQEYNFDVSISFKTDSNIINIINSTIHKIPVVISIRNNIQEQYGKRMFVKLYKLLLQIVNPYIIVNSEENKNWLISNYHLNKDKCICIYNPKDIVSIHNLSNEVIDDSFFKTKEIIILTVGRLDSQKGHLHLLRVFNLLKKTHPCRLVICGIGPMEATLTKIAYDFGISDAVYFAGFCNNPYKYMKQSDIFVFPSLFEGQPNALIEALICGCPIVSTDCDYGPREILADGKYGILTKKLDGKIEDPTTTPLTEAELDMHDKILYLIQHPEERERLRKLSSEQIHLFDKERCIKKYYDVFRAAAEGRLLTDIN